MAHDTTPTIHLIARPAVDLDGMRSYLTDVGGATWLDRRLDDDGSPNPGELLVEFGGRACYRSWEPGLNANVTRVGPTSAPTSGTSSKAPTAACSSTPTTRSRCAT